MKVKLILIGLTCICTNLARAGFDPVTLTPGSFTADVVVERTAPAAIGVAVNATIDNGLFVGGSLPGGYTWNEQGFFTANPTHGLPAPGTTFVALSNSAMSFVMAPSYTDANTILIDGSVTNASWKFTTPAAYSSLSFLSSGGSGGRVINVTIQYADGTTSTGSFSSPDWFNGTVGVGWIANGRCNAGNHVEDNANSNNPRLYYRQVGVANVSTAITNVVLANGSTSGGHVGIFAVSGSTDGINYTPITGTGYNCDTIVEKEAAQPGAMTTFTTVSMDGGTANNGTTWYEQGYMPLAPTTGLPPAGSTITSLALADHHYQMPASYAVNNCIYVDANNPTANLTLASPALYSALSFLSANANGTNVNQCIMQYADGSQETNIFVSRDWFNNAPYAYAANGRINLDDKTFQYINSGNPRLYEAQFVLGNTTSPLTNIVIQYIEGRDATTRAIILAVSAATGAISPILGENPKNLATPEGGNAAFSATISGGTTPFTNLWQFSADGTNYTDLTDNAQVSGATTTDLTLTGVGLTNAGYYRLHVSNVAGSATTAAAALTVVISSLSDVTQPGDPIVLYNGSTPGAEGVEHAIDNLTSKYLNQTTPSPATPVGFVVTPAVGRTHVTAMRFYTANDSPERDPSDYKLEGSNDGGTHYSLIASNALSLPDARNDGGLALDPLTQPMAQVIFANANSYTKYRVTFSHDKGNVIMQIGEVELLGEVDTSGVPYFTQEPVSTTVYDGNAASFAAAANGTPTPDLRWQIGTNGVYVDLADSTHVFGSQSGSLTINPASFGDAADYICIAKNTAGSETSGVVHLTVITTLPDVTLPTDTVSSFGGEISSSPGVAASAFDNSTTVYANGGSGDSAPAGFPPFKGPVGLTITPRGTSLVTGLRIYTSDASTVFDPADYKLEGSSDGGTNYTVISSGALALPATRNTAGQALDPVTQAIQEVLFANTQYYTSYRLTFTTVKDPDTAATLRLGEVELLGLAGPAAEIMPTFQNVVVGGTATIMAAASGSGTITYQWQKKTGSGYVSLSDGGSISGATNDTLTVNPVAFADAGQYRVVMTDSVALSASPVVIINVLSTLTDVTAPGDTITIVGGASPEAEAVAHAIDDATDKYLNWGLPDGVAAVPFLGPVGLTVTPAVGGTLVTAVRVYTAADAPGRDPTDYTLEGSTDGGATFTPISTGDLILPTERNATGLALDPVGMPNWEARFSNTRGYTSYRLTFTHVKDAANVDSMQLAEVELLGMAVPTLSITAGAGGSLTITTSQPGTLLSTTNLAAPVWVSEGAISGSTTITPTPGVPAKFFRVSVP